jgi:hypothetical protein
MANASGNGHGQAAEVLCLACGLCCNGVIFGDVKIQPGDDPEAIKLIGQLLRGVKAAKKIPNAKVLQPCPAHDGRVCCVYSLRPRHCREFDCLLLLSVKDGKTGVEAALRVIRKARRQVEKVQTLLRKLGDEDESVSLAKRFRKTSRRVERSGLDGDSAALYGDLTLAMHELNLQLAEVFYPGER